MQTLEEIGAAALACGEPPGANDCVVRALALALDMPYAVVHAHCEPYRRHTAGRRFKGDVTKVAGALLGREVAFTYFIPEGCKTVRSFAANMPKGRYLVRVVTNKRKRIGHMFCVRDYEVPDWMAGSSRRVEQFARIPE